MKATNPATFILFLLTTGSMTGCVDSPAWLATAGPTTKAIEKTAIINTNITVLDLTNEITQKLILGQRKNLFSEFFSDINTANSTVGIGDSLEVTIYEAAPALLFGSADTSSLGAAKTITLPEQLVSRTGVINVPFVGSVKAAGRSTAQVEKTIVAGLNGKANQPQALVRLTKYNAAGVTIVGEVTNSLRMPLTPRGERILDALAAAGGQKQAISKTSIQLSRGMTSQIMSLEAIINDPRQNIYLQAGDVVSLLNKPLSFSVLGATGKNEEVDFESQGISLTQALARVGGLQDNRANARGVFIFRFEDRLVINNNSASIADHNLVTSNGKVPVVYRVDLSDPASFFRAQNFMIKDNDILYVANAPSNEINKFLGILSSSIFTINGLGSLGQ